MLSQFSLKNILSKCKICIEIYREIITTQTGNKPTTARGCTTSHSWKSADKSAVTLWTLSGGGGPVLFRGYLVPLPGSQPEKKAANNSYYYY